MITILYVSIFKLFDQKKYETWGTLKNLKNFRNFYKVP